MTPSEAIDQTQWTNLLDMTGGDAEFVDELVDTYLEDGERQVEALRAAVESGSVDDLVRPAHSLKSSSLNVGALRLGGLCRTLEEASRNGEVPHAAEWVAQVAAAFAEARQALLAERAGRTSG